MSATRYQAELFFNSCQGCVGYHQSARDARRTGENLAPCSAWRSGTCRSGHPSLPDHSPQGSLPGTSSPTKKTCKHREFLPFPSSFATSTPFLRLLRNRTAHLPTPSRRLILEELPCFVPRPRITPAFPSSLTLPITRSSSKPTPKVRAMSIRLCEASSR